MSEYLRQSARMPNRVPARVPSATDVAIGDGVNLALNSLSPEQSTRMQAYLAQSAPLHDRVPGRAPAATAVALNDAVMQVIGAPADTAATLASTTLASTTPAAGAASSGDVATVTAPRSQGMLAILGLGAPEHAPAGITYGLATGTGVAPAVPVTADFDHTTALAVVAAFQNPDHRTADAVATYAAVPATDPALEERVSLVLAVYRIDGTEDLIRHFIATTHMQLIIQEVARHIDFSTLSESDKYRLAAIAAVAQTELEDKVLRMNALIQAQNLTKPELLQLLAAYDTDAQRKLTYQRLHDDGKVDRAAELDIRLAQYQIVKAFEAGH